MKRIILILIIIFILSACEAEPVITPEYISITEEPVIPNSGPVSDGIKSYEYVDPLVIGVWQSASEVPSEVVLRKAGTRLEVEFDTHVEAVALITRGVSNISAPLDGLTITLSAVDRPFHILVGIREIDESWYHTSIILNPEDGNKTFEIDLSYLALDQNSIDENYQLDKTQIAEIILVDISGFVGPIGKGTLTIDEIVYWRGNPVFPQLTCGSQSPDRTFLVGIDGNFIPTGEAVGIDWFVDEQLVDPIDQFALQGVNAFRLRTWVGDEGESRLEYATALGLRAQDAGMQIAPVFFLTEEWADVSKQPVPEIWEEMSLNDQGAAIQQYALETAGHLLDAGINPIYYEIGNEIDFGISGVFAEIAARDLNHLQEETWIDAAKLILAAQEGIKQVDPDARFMLHIAQGYNPHFTMAFFQSMQNLGVQIDLAGLSYYPSAFGVFSFEGLCNSINRLQNELGLPVVISEFAYPASIPQTGLFAGWRHAMPGYPLNPGGQAAYISAFLDDMRSHPNVVGVNLFEPAFYWESTIWEAFALYDENGNARPALGTLTLP